MAISGLQLRRSRRWHESINWSCRTGTVRKIGLLALQAQAYSAVEPYPLDVLGAETEGMIGYVLEQEFGNLLPFEVPFATLLTMIEVDPADPAFGDPTKFVGPVYDKPEADQLAASKGWTFKIDGARWRRVVRSPLPKRIFELRPIRWLLEQGTIVICAGGGGIPTAYSSDGNRTLCGIEAVIDKDLASELLARDLDADLFVMATDVDGVYLDWGRPNQRKLARATVSELGTYSFAGGSMGRRLRPRCNSRRKLENVPRLAHCRTSRGSSPARRARTSWLVSKPINCSRLPVMRG